MKTETKHTPTPWKYREEEGDAFIENPVTGFGIAKVQGQGPTNQANAAFIVQSVNRAELFEDLLRIAKQWHGNCSAGPDQCGACSIITRAQEPKS